jgi:YVTN family beta-propeller protein
MPRLTIVAGLALVGLTVGIQGQGAQKAVPPTPAAASRVYVSDETGTQVVIIDPATGQVAGRIEVGKRPRGLKVSPDGKQLFVALSGSPIGGPGVDESKLPPADRAADGIGLIDVGTHQVLRKFKSGDDPESFDIAPDGKTLYVSNEDSAEMSVLDLATGTVRSRVKVGEEPEGVTVRPGGREVYVSCEGENEVVAIDTTTLKVLAHIKTAARPRSIAFTKDGAIAFSTNENGGAVTVIDAATHKPITTIQIAPAGAAAAPRAGARPAGGAAAPPAASGRPAAGAPGAPSGPRPMGAVISPDGKQLYVSLGRAGSVAVIDVATRKLARIISSVGARPWGIGVSPDGKKLYTANGPSGDVSIVDIATGKVDQKVSTGGSPWGVAVWASR